MRKNPRSMVEPETSILKRVLSITEGRVQWEQLREFKISKVKYENNIVGSPFEKYLYESN